MVVICALRLVEAPAGSGVPLGAASAVVGSCTSGNIRSAETSHEAFGVGATPAKRAAGSVCLDVRAAAACAWAGSQPSERCRCALNGCDSDSGSPKDPERPAEGWSAHLGVSLSIGSGLGAPSATPAMPAPGHVAASLGVTSESEKTLARVLAIFGERRVRGEHVAGMQMKF